MKAKYILLTSMLFGIFLHSCTKSDGGGQPPTYFVITFHFVDSIGNNILPYDLPENPVVNPESFYAYSDRMNDIGKYFGTEDGGYLFTISEQVYYLQNDALWQQDSVFYFYSCFNQVCDTFEVRKTDLSGGSNTGESSQCGAKWIIYQSDTLDKPYCRSIPIKNY